MVHSVSNFQNAVTIAPAELTLIKQITTIDDQLPSGNILILEKISTKEVN